MDWADGNQTTDWWAETGEALAFRLVDAETVEEEALRYIDGLKSTLGLGGLLYPCIEVDAEQGRLRGDL